MFLIKVRLIIIIIIAWFYPKENLRRDQLYSHFADVRTEVQKSEVVSLTSQGALAINFSGYF